MLSCVQQQRVSEPPHSCIFVVQAFIDVALAILGAWTQR